MRANGNGNQSMLNLINSTLTRKSRKVIHIYNQVLRVVSNQKLSIFVVSELERPNLLFADLIEFKRI